MMTTQIKWGILGCGRITRRGLIPGIQGSKEAKLVALASRRAGVAEQLARECDCPKVYHSYEELIDDPEIHAVYIPTSGEEHRPWTLRAAAAGKHVLCEKSLALSVAEAEEMVAACAEAGVVLQEAFMWRHHPRNKQVQELLSAGTIGELRQIKASFSFDIERSDWRLDPARGGGSIWDVGCYGVNAARMFAGGEPDSIHARAHFHTTGVDMTMHIGLTFPNQILAQIDCSFEAPYRCQLELVGTAGTMLLPDAFLPGPQATLLVRRGVGPESREAAELITFPVTNQYVDQVNDFCWSIRAGKLLPPGENGLQQMRVLEEAQRVARSYRPE